MTKTDNIEEFDLAPQEAVIVTAKPPTGKRSKCNWKNLDKLECPSCSSKLILHRNIDIFSRDDPEYDDSTFYCSRCVFAIKEIKIQEIVRKIHNIKES
jgi:C4-type Zn-finger protein